MAKEKHDELWPRHKKGYVSGDKVHFYYFPEIHKVQFCENRLNGEIIELVPKKWHEAKIEELKKENEEAVKQVKSLAGWVKLIAEEWPVEEEVRKDSKEDLSEARVFLSKVNQRLKEKTYKKVTKLEVGEKYVLRYTEKFCHAVGEKGYNDWDDYDVQLRNCTYIGITNPKAPRLKQRQIFYVKDEDVDITYVMFSNDDLRHVVKKLD